MRFPEGLELKTYGQQLLAGREAKGWTQQQLSKKLFLPVHFIRALEAGEHGMLPEIPYVMSMYRKAATAVGIDPEPMIQACKDFQERERQPPDEQARTRPGAITHVRQPTSHGTAQRRREPAKPPEATVAPQPTAQQKRRAGQGKGDGVIVLLGCGLVLVLGAVVLLNSEFWPTIRLSPTPSAPTTEDTQLRILEAPATPQQSIPDMPEIVDSIPSERPSEGPELGTVRFIFTSDADDNRSSWTSIEDARGVPLFEGVPESPASVDLPTAAGIRIRLGRPGLVRWQQPGQPPQPMPETQPGIWMELIPGPAVSQVAPATAEVTTEEPTPAPEVP